jgi:hypothetical protein
MSVRSLYGDPDPIEVLPTTRYNQVSQVSLSSRLEMQLSG